MPSIENLLASLPSKYIRWTITPEQIAALRPFRSNAEKIARSAYGAMGLPVVVGKPTLLGAWALEPAPSLHLAYKHSIDVPSYGLDIGHKLHAVADELLDPRKRDDWHEKSIPTQDFAIKYPHLIPSDILSKEPTIEGRALFIRDAEIKIRAQAGVFHELMCFDHTFLRNSSGVIMEAISENTVIEPRVNRTPYWHADAYMDLDIAARVPDIPLSRSYLWRTTEQAIFVPDNKVYEDGGLHPLVRKLVDNQHRLVAYAKEICYQPMIGSAIQACTRHLQEAGLTWQAKPYEFVLAGAVSLHTGARPTTPKLSKFGRFILDPQWT